MNRKIKSILILLVFSMITIAYVKNKFFYDLQQIKGQEIIQEVNSPDNKYTIIAYLNSGGATTDYAVLCSVRDNEESDEENIYWNYPANQADIKWINEYTVHINGIELDVTKDKYDWRHQ